MTLMEAVMRALTELGEYLLGQLVENRREIADLASHAARGPYTSKVH